MEDPPQGGGGSEVILAQTPGIFPDRREIFIAAGKHRTGVLIIKTPPLK